jgi:hypothetical protein
LRKQNKKVGEIWYIPEPMAPEENGVPMHEFASGVPE